MTTSMGTLPFDLQERLVKEGADYVRYDAVGAPLPGAVGFLEPGSTY
jgi:hypothetical protein